MAPDLYPLLFEQVRGIVDKFFDQQGQVRPVSCIFFRTQNCGFNMYYYFFVIIGDYIRCQHSFYRAYYLYNEVNIR